LDPSSILGASILQAVITPNATLTGSALLTLLSARALLFKLSDENHPAGAIILAALMLYGRPNRGPLPARTLTRPNLTPAWFDKHTGAGLAIITEAKEKP
jgi:hypothetical protein